MKTDIVARIEALKEEYQLNEKWIKENPYILRTGRLKGTELERIEFKRTIYKERIERSGKLLKRITQLKGILKKNSELHLEMHPILADEINSAG